MSEEIQNEFLNTPIGQHGKHIKPENMKYSWSKWGGVNLGFIERTPEWVCQICGQTEPPAIDPFLFNLSDREFIRICPLCHAKRMKYHITTLFEMIKVCRERKGNVIELMQDLEEDMFSMLGIDNLL